MSDIRDMNSTDRQSALMAMPIPEIKEIIQKLMADNRQTELAARLDALTILTLRDGK